MRQKRTLDGTKLTPVGGVKVNPNDGHLAAFLLHFMTNKIDLLRIVFDNNSSSYLFAAEHHCMQIIKIGKILLETGKNKRFKKWT